MNWNDAKPTLTTLESIARFEKEVNRLAGETEVWVLRGIQTKNLKLSFGSAVHHVVFTHTDGTVSSAVAELDAVDIPLNPITKFSAFDAADALLGWFDTRGAKSMVIFANTGLQATISNEAAWAMNIISHTWKDKLDLAIEAVENDILTILLPKLNAATDEEALAQITNAETFRKACDLKALELIFRDLGLGTFNQMHEMKAQNYAGAYKEEITSAFLRMRTGEDGTDGQRIVTVGKIVR